MKKMANQLKKPEDHDHGFIGCCIKQLPKEQWVAAAAKAIEINPNNAPALHLLKLAMPDAVLQPEHLAVVTTKYWGSGGVQLTVGFLDNPPAALRTRILSHMNAWGAYANVRFVESLVNPQVRINRGAGGGYWSYLGTDILNIPANQATMNLDSFSMTTADSEFYRVIRHETGHTLGFPHEHMRSEIVNAIDYEKAIAYFMASQGWSRDKVIAQVLTPLDQSSLIATAQADPNSIMCYWLPGSIMKNGIAIPGGTNIDTQDGQFAGLVYPRNSGLFSTYYTWRGCGTVNLNITNSNIHAGSAVYAAISEYTSNPRQTRFIGSARMGICNISPYEGGVHIWAEINWSSPINVCIDLAVRS